jgi:AraC-like DNA-binding protein
MHSHTFFEFTIILDGSCNSIINNGKKTILHKGDMIFLRPGDIHMLNPITKNYRHRDFYVTEDKMKHICDIFSDTFYEELLSPEVNLQYILDINEYTLLNQKSFVFDTPYLSDSKTEEKLDQLHTSIIIQLLGVIINRSLPTNTNVPEWLSSLFLHLSSFHYVNNSINDIIATTGYSHSYICQKFKSTYGTTLLDCLNKSKIILSTNLLGKEKIIDIAMSLGWDNPKNYTIAFKKVFGITPQKYIAATKSDKVCHNANIVFPVPPQTSHLGDLPPIVQPKNEEST